MRIRDEAELAMFIHFLLWFGGVALGIRHAKRAETVAKIHLKVEVRVRH